MKSFSQTSLMPLLVLAQLCALAPACGDQKSSGTKVPTPQSPSGSIKGGLNVVQTLHIVPAGSIATDGQTLHYEPVDDRRPNQVIIDSAHMFQVTGSSCDTSGCSITYTQTQVTTGLSAFVRYHLVDEDGRSWGGGELKLQGQVPQVPADFRFTPRFGEKVTIKFPIQSSDYQPLETAPKIVSSQGTAGDLSLASCTTTFCEISYQFRWNDLQPRISFQLSMPESLTPVITLVPTPEVITYQTPQKVTYAGNRSILLVQGVDYVSSWNRPANQIQVVDAAGLNRPYFSCSETGCLAENVNFVDSQSLWMTYRVGQEKNTGRVEWKLATPKLTAQGREVIVDANQSTELNFVLGKDYSSENDIPATSISFDRPWNVDVSTEQATCDRTGKCSVKIRYSGTKNFVNLNFTLKVGNYESPAQVLKITPRIYSLSGEIKVWDDKQTWQMVEIRPGRDYQTSDGSKAKEIWIYEKGYQLRIKDADQLSDVNRNKVFTCDDEGVCRGMIGHSSFASEGPLKFQILTSTGRSGMFQVSLQFVRDVPEFKDPNEYLTYFGTPINDTADSFSLRLASGQDYTSEFPAEKLVVTLPAEFGVTLTDGPEITCADGVCVLEGNFTSEKGFVDLSLVLKSSFGESISKKLRLIRGKFATIKPNLNTYKPAASGSDQFNVVIDRGDKIGYNADKPASKLRVLARKGLLVDAMDAESLEVPCEEGRCIFRIKASSTSNSIQYQLVDENGKPSVTVPLTVLYPQPLAVDVQVNVPSEFGSFEFDLPVFESFERNRTLILENQEGLTFTAVDDYRRFNVKATTTQPLQANQELKLKYKLKVSDIVSNEAVLTLRAIPTLSLKKELVIRAQRDANSADAYTVKLTYADHFNALPSSVKVTDYFYQPALFTLQWENPNLLQSSNVACDRVQLECVYRFVKATAGPLDPVKARIRGGIYSYRPAPVLAGSFTLVFE